MAKVWLFASTHTNYEPFAVFCNLLLVLCSRTSNGSSAMICGENSARIGKTDSKDIVLLTDPNAGAILRYVDIVHIFGVSSSSKRCYSYRDV
jgi:hypothetical protein